MSLEVVGSYRNSRSIKEQYKTYISYHAVLIMNDGTTCDGIIEGIDGDEIIVLVGEDVVIDEKGDNMNRQRPMGGRFRRFRRNNFPMDGINRIDLIRYPFINPIYPYPYPYPYPFFPY
ncbi:hypothetical protein [Clostridium sp.]|uniref:hypothetical protein n=1 Tax=Clostridium sp. TaxID=1506 RepID=UPI003F340DE8